jgi:hypothetical protein
LRAEATARNGRDTRRIDVVSSGEHGKRLGPHSENAAIGLTAEYVLARRLAGKL